MASPSGAQVTPESARNTCRDAAAASAGSRLARFRPGRFRLRLPTGTSRRWLSIFAVSSALFLIRFLVPVPVGQADNRDGPRLMCSLNLGSVTGRYPRYFRFAHFEYVPRAACCGRVPYPSSELVPLVAARVLTPVLGLAGTLNLLALGVVMCIFASVGIASLAVGLRIRLWARLLVAAVLWLIMADAAFFDVFGTARSWCSA